MFVIEGPLWFGAALLICGAHALYLRGWRRERRAHLAWWQRYDAYAQTRHEEFMRAIDRDTHSAWDLSSGQQRGQA